MNSINLITAFDIIYLGQRPGGYDFAGFVNTLLHTSTRALGIDAHSVRTTLRTDIPDGGVDAEVTAKVPNDPQGLLGTETVWQYKARSEGGIKLSGKDGIKEGMTHSHALRRLKEGYTYALCVCTLFFLPPIWANPGERSFRVGSW